MTIETLLDLPPEGLEALSDDELHKALEPYFKFTRPVNPLSSTVDKAGVLRPGGSAPVRKPASSGFSQQQILKALLDSDDLTIEKVKMMQGLRK